MPFVNSRKTLVRGGKVVQVFGRPVEAFAQEGGGWNMRWNDPFTGEPRQRSYPDEAAAQTAGDELEADYLAAADAAEDAKSAFHAKWG